MTDIADRTLVLTRIIDASPDKVFRCWSEPELIKQLFDSLRQYPAWKAHVRNRGKSPQEEIEVALVRDYSKPQLPY